MIGYGYGVGRRRRRQIPVAGRITDTLIAPAGLRLLVPGYTGPLARYRRQTDNAEQNFFAEGGIGISSAALQAFHGSSSGSIVTLYAQDGSGRHWTNPNAATQPRGVNAGVIDTMSGKPTIIFRGGAFLTAAVAAGTFPNGISAFGLMRVDPPLFQFDGVWWSRSSGTAAARPLDQYNNTRVTNGITQIQTGTLNLAALTSPTVISQIMTTTQLTEYAQGVLASTLNHTGYSDSATAIYIGNRAGGGTRLTGALSEIMFVAGAASDATRIAIERDMGSYYGITVA